MMDPKVVLARADRFAFCTPSRDEVHLERREQEDGSVLWVILRCGFAWTREGQWEYESMPSSRTAGYLKRARWFFDEAWLECERIERDLGFHLSPAEALSRCLTALAASPEWAIEILEGAVLAVTNTEDGGHSLWFPDDPRTWRANEIRALIARYVDACRALGVSVDMTPTETRRAA